MIYRFIRLKILGKERAKDADEAEEDENDDDVDEDIVDDDRDLPDVEKAILARLNQRFPSAADQAFITSIRTASSNSLLTTYLTPILRQVFANPGDWCKKLKSTFNSPPRFTAVLALIHNLISKDSSNCYFQSQNAMRV
jgi:hypothetical protein